MGIDLTKLAGQGRAFSAARLYTQEELDAWITLQRERHLSRQTAADYVRNGIMTVEALDKALKNEFVPKTQDEARTDMEETLKKRGEEFSDDGFDEMSKSELQKEIEKRGLSVSGNKDELIKRLRSEHD